MTIMEIISRLDQIDDSLTICAFKDPSWRPESPAELCPANRAPAGCKFPYFLEISIAKNVLRAWSYARNGRLPDLSECCRALIYYAENDAYIPTEGGG